MLRIQRLDPNPPNSNPFIHDLTRMGTSIGNNVIVMYMNNEGEECQHVIVINKKTGERVLLQFEPATTILHSEVDDVEELEKCWFWY